MSPSRGILPLLGLGLVLAAFGVGSAVARSPTDSEQASLAARVSDFEAAMRANDFPAVFRAIPPRILTHLAESGGVSVDELQRVFVARTAELVAAVTVESFGMDLANAEQRELQDGTPYVLIPTETVMSLDGNATAMRSHTLALLDGGIWYLVRVSDLQQLEILRRVYPEYEGVDFPRGSMEALGDQP